MSEKLPMTTQEALDILVQVSRLMEILVKSKEAMEVFVALERNKAELEKRLNDMNAMIAEKNRQISVLNFEIERQNIQVSELESRIKAANDDLSLVNGALEQQKAEALAQLNQYRSDLQKQADEMIAGFEMRKSALTREIEAKEALLQRAVDQINNLKNKL